MGDPTRKAALFDALATTGKALSNGKRLELLDLLAQGERSVDALAKAAGLGLTTASAHLQTLKQAGLVTTRRDGVRIHYRLAGDDVAALYALLQRVAHTHLAAADQARAAYLTGHTHLGPVPDDAGRDVYAPRLAADPKPTRQDADAPWHPVPG
ncbi:ArsR/SmtB family transcription factor [Streptomyces sp. NPDC058964]|uniref:ArsR/SmtB family transcription factor n=1 Tax=Streptomyces sp. NPDC058964 TaxID=3346681 RepID=UPI0036C7FEDA